MADTPERRELSFDSLDEAVAEVERLAQGEVRVTGSHSFAQIIEHLARTHEVAIGKATPPRLPFMMRLIMPLMKGMVLNAPVKPGLKLPDKAQSFFWPQDDVDLQQAISHLKESVEQYKALGPLPVHPVFGKASREQIDRMNCGHCAMHLSFVHPV